MSTNPLADAANPPNPTRAALSRVTTASGLLDAAGGDYLLAMLKSLGFWVAAIDESPETRPWPTKLDDYPGKELGAEMLYRQSELSRGHAVLGALRGSLLAAKNAHARATKQAQKSLKEKQRTEYEVARSSWVRKIEEAFEEEVPVPAKLIAAEPKPIKYTAAEAAALVETTTEVLAASDRVVLIESAIMALEGIREANEGLVKTLSREISRRGDELNARI